MNIRNSVAARLFVGFGIVILVFGAGIALSLVRLAGFNDAMSEITGPELVKVETVNAWATSVSESMRHTRNMLIVDDKVEIHSEIAKTRELIEKSKQYADTMATRVQSAEGKALLQSALVAKAIVIPLDEEFIRQIEAGDFRGAKETMLTKSRPAQLELFGRLQKLAEFQQVHMQARADALAASYRGSRVLLIALSVGAVLIACVLAVLITRAIKNPLNQAVRVLAEIGKGNYATPVAVASSDETGQVLSALDAMQRSLKERTDAESVTATENGRIRTALDRVSAGAMLADPDGKIIYMNDAVRAIFRNQASEIRKQMPQFDAERILGSSFDAFHKVPSHQRNMLASLTGTHRADVKLGGAVLRVVANPVVAADGRRIGTVVEWFDRTQEVSAEEEVKAIVAKAIEGVLTSRIREQGKDGFFKTLAEGMNRLLDNMTEVVRTMTRTAAEVSTGAEEISRGNADLSQRTEEQASSLEETASSMEEMTSTVKNNADNAAQANQLAAAARLQAEKGGSVVGAAVAAMGEINASSKRIADIISVIDEIAFQTNLLALNAAVEAARAGEQGRGFAVVASEVRNLASRSAEAAKEIKTLIQDSVGKVAEGTKLVDESGKALGEIVIGVKKVTDVMAEIASSSREQASGIEQVNRAITMMDDVTQQNAALVEEASAAAQALNDQARGLIQLMARYDVGDAPAAATSRPARAAAPGRTTPPTERRAAKRPWTGLNDSAGRSSRKTDSRATASRTGTDADETAWKDF